MAEYNNINKERRQNFIAFPATVSVSSNAVHSNDSYNKYSLPRACGRCGLTHDSSGHCPASATQCGKFDHPNQWWHICHTRTPSRSPSRRGYNWSRARCQSCPCHGGGSNQYQKGKKNTYNSIPNSQNHNNWSKNHATSNLPSKPHTKIEKNLLLKNQRYILTKFSPKAEGLHWHWQTWPKTSHGISPYQSSREKPSIYPRGKGQCWHRKLCTIPYSIQDDVYQQLYHWWTTKTSHHPVSKPHHFRVLNRWHSTSKCYSHLQSITL